MMTPTVISIERARAPLSDARVAVTRLSADASNPSAQTLMRLQSNAPKSLD